MIRFCRVFIACIQLLTLCMAQMVFSVTGVAAVTSVGSLDGIEYMNAVGWVDVSDRPNGVASVEIVIDGPAGSGTFAGRVNAANLTSQFGTDRDAKTRRFEIPVPTTFRDAKSHLLYAYVVKTNGTRVLMEGAPKTFTSACSIKRCTSARIRAKGQLTVREVGELEQVYDHDASGCENFLPDVPPRAFRDAGGQVHFISSQITAYQMLGPTLGSLQTPACQPVMTSVGNPDPLAESYHEWLSAIYTHNGDDVYGAGDNEWYPSTIDRQCDLDFDRKFRMTE